MKGLVKKYDTLEVCAPRHGTEVAVLTPTDASCEHLHTAHERNYQIPQRTLATMEQVYKAVSALKKFSLFKRPSLSNLERPSCGDIFCDTFFYQSLVLRGELSD
jgi:hypothetical protein